MKPIEITKEKLMLIIPVIVIMAAMAVYFVVFAPLLEESRKKYIECRTVESEVLKVRAIIKAAGEIEGRRILMTEGDISQVTDELTRHGRSKGVDFISIDPGEAQKEKGSDYKILPIKMEIESTYEQLGTFLGSLDDLEKGLVTVESFSIIPDTNDAARLSTDLVVDIYLSGRENNNTMEK